MIYCKLDLSKEKIKKISQLPQVEEVRGTYNIDYIHGKTGQIFVKIRTDTDEKLHTTTKH